MNSWENLVNNNPNNIPKIRDLEIGYRTCVNFDHSATFNIPENCTKNANLAAWEKFLVDEDDESGSLNNIFVESPITFNTNCTAYFPEFFKSIRGIVMIIADGWTNENDVNNTECLLTLNDNSKNASRKNIFSYFPKLDEFHLLGVNANKLISENRYFKGPLICGNMVDEWRLNVREANRLNEIDAYRRFTKKNLLIGCKEDTRNPNCPAAPSTQASNQQSSIVQASYYSRLNFVDYQWNQSMHTVCIR
ncbi:hypothetical protein WR25_20557 [Diploscapter pachys]|uniref:Uncharacterized protein n=1 Tax=Diploscapter pachys TaxID=2018661 RepID=A0A2A2JSS0_9BILA|nr:hypothetical protein WR25_20557 [Diploscapter pachys]